ncbi:MAG: hypothetical protein J6U54_22900 [Clostridiales bacterium]|nr:hypothetical protein [Clostridiales bacterium]
MIDVNQAGLDQMIRLFETDRSSHHIYDTSEKLSKSAGKAIDEINNCFTSFDDYCTNINNLYTATSSYLHKVAYNISLCEESNGG